MNTRDYGKKTSPRRMFARGGNVEPGMTDHLPTGPSWWPEPLGKWMNPPTPEEAAAAAAEQKRTNQALARDEEARQKRIEASDKPADMAFKATRELTKPVTYARGGAVRKRGR